jgi:hypothetical protein
VADSSRQARGTTVAIAIPVTIKGTAIMARSALEPDVTM